MTAPFRLAHEWLRSTYDAPVELLPPRVAKPPQTWVFSAAPLGATGAPGTTAPVSLLTSLVCVPTNGMPPFHPATDDPWQDLADFERDPQPRDPAEQARRTNARGAVLAAHAAVGGAPATALPWQPAHEGPTWWDDFLRRYSPRRRRPLPGLGHGDRRGRRTGPPRLGSRRR